MFGLGGLLGFVGAGGSGFIIAILTVLFGVPIHTALGTSLAAMVFTTLSGAYSHFRQGNISVKTGLIVGCFGAVASYFGSKLASLIPVHSMHWLTAGMLFLSAVILLVRLFMVQKITGNIKKTVPDHLHIRKAAFVGIITGLLSGTFGIGAAPFIQIGLLVIMGLTLKQSVGTTMLVILPIALAGGVGYYFEGLLDFGLLLEVVAGTMIGSYAGAKFTGLAPQPVLKSAMVLTPIVAGAILLIK
ncbi:sulfite exporter TauE/SafE family protein [Bacillus salipaludis]|uniref:Probable membrane transporter protein n=2 Tax=Bacillus salipaludis TaxID=2547811 RepID=A0A4R5VMP7_9BACI|nr:sulfite exporter TauE/SafE family protein [Bacillus salipaludis]MDQ6596085.1 sulfite exporter TauE/SafE family protein [Bacillus salipaludis]TDK59204.1 sulfite exporter TauE/SafE family protein [Bacillus salipaludis]